MVVIRISDSGLVYKVHSSLVNKSRVNKSMVNGTRYK